MRDNFDETALECAVTIMPTLRFCRKRGIISFFSADTEGFGIQVMKKDFMRMFPEYQIEQIPGNREQAVSIYQGQRFFTMLTEDDDEDVQTSDG